MRKPQHIQVLHDSADELDAGASPALIANRLRRLAEAMSNNRFDALRTVEGCVADQRTNT